MTARQPNSGQRISNLVARTGAAIAAALGCTAIAGWILDRPRLASWGQGWIPLAPSSALLFLLLGIWVFCSLHRHAATAIAAGPPLKEYQREYAFAVKKGDTALRDRLEQGLLVVKGSGEYRQIYDRWPGLYEPPPAIALPARRFLRPSLTIGVSLSAQRGRREAGAFLAGL